MIPLPGPYRIDITLTHPQGDVAITVRASTDAMARHVAAKIRADFAAKQKAVRQTSPMDTFFDFLKDRDIPWPK